eukprot:augustus_masked-scaffold_3-processed-gene-15.1-mRNA-1 protein AED:1.00 eAED:1.00 QI:0/0/0/0/1/1/2/0/439
MNGRYIPLDVKTNITVIREAKSTAKDLEDFEADFDETGNFLGEGALGTVWEYKLSSSGKSFAVKKILMINLDWKDSEAYFREIGILNNLQHPNILKVFDHYCDDNQVYLVSELCSIDLFKQLEKFEQFNEETVRQIAQVLVDALLCVHDKKYIHRDIKPSNILFREVYAKTIRNENFENPEENGVFREDRIFQIGNKKYQIVVANFGLATSAYKREEVAIEEEFKFAEELRLFSSKEKEKKLFKRFRFLRQACGTKAYQAPEKLDFIPEDNWKNVSDIAKDFIQKVLVQDPDKRCSFEQMSKHPWLTENLLESSGLDKTQGENLPSLSNSGFKRYNRDRDILQVTARMWDVFKKDRTEDNRAKLVQAVSQIEISDEESYVEGEEKEATELVRYNPELTRMYTGFTLVDKLENDSEEEEALRDEVGRPRRSYTDDFDDEI